MDRIHLLVPERHRRRSAAAGTASTALCCRCGPGAAPGSGPGSEPRRGVSISGRAVRRIADWTSSRPLVSPADGVLAPPGRLGPACRAPARRRGLLQEERRPGAREAAHRGPEAVGHRCRLDDRPYSGGCSRPVYRDEPQRIFRCTTLGPFGPFEVLRAQPRNLRRDGWVYWDWVDTMARGSNIMRAVPVLDFPATRRTALLNSHESSCRAATRHSRQV